jgi:hypothetical protein
MDMSLVFLITVGLLAAGMVSGLVQTATVVVRQRRSRETRPRSGKRQSACRSHHVLNAVETAIGITPRAEQELVIENWCLWRERDL